MSRKIIQADTKCISSMKENSLKLGYIIMSYKTYSYGWTARLCNTVLIDDVPTLRDSNSFISMKFGESEIDAVRNVYIEVLEKEINGR